MKYRVIITSVVPPVLNGSPSGSYFSNDAAREYWIDSFTMNRSMSETDTFQFTIKQFDGLVSENNYVQIIVPANLENPNPTTIEGYITDYTVDPEGNISFQCVGMLYELSRYCSIPNVRFDNQQFLGAAAYILRNYLKNTQTFTTPVPSASAGLGTNYYPFDVNYPDQGYADPFITWDIGDVSTLRDPLEVTTIDLSSEERKLAQIKTLVDAELSVYFKYGGFDPATNRKLLDIGTFQVDSMRSFYDFKFNASKNVELPIRGMIAFGGTFKGASGESKIINLSHAAKRILDKPKKRKKNPYTREYYEIFNPVGFDPENPPFIHITAPFPFPDFVTPGQIMTKRFDEFVPATRDDPPALEKERAGFQMYKKACSELLKSTYGGVSYNVSMENFPLDVLPGMKIFLQKTFHASDLDPMTYTILWKINQNATVNDYYWVQSQSLTFNDDGTISADMVLVEKPEYDTRDFDAAVIRLTIKKPKADTTDDYTFEPTCPVFGYYEVDIPAGTSPGISGGAEVTFNKIAVDPEDTFGDLTVFPDNATTVVKYWGYTDNYHGSIQYISPPLTGITTFLVSVKINGGWTVNDSINLKIYVEFQL